MNSTLRILLIILFPLSITAQQVSPIAQELSQKHRQYNLTDIALFTKDLKAPKFNTDKRSGDFLVLDPKAFSTIQEKAPQLISVEISLNEKTISLDLFRVSIISDQYTLKATSNIQPHENGLYYRGIISGKESSLATLSIINGVIHVMFSDRTGNYEISQDRSGRYRFIQGLNQDALPPFECYTSDEGVDINLGELETNRSSGDCLEVYIVCDYQSFLDNGSSVINTETWALGMMSDVAALYANINIPIVVTGVQVYTSSDPFAGLTELNTVLNAFVTDIQANFTGRMAHLISTRNLGGGIAYGIGGLCNDYPTYPGPYCFSSSLSISYSPYPTYSRNITILAHEMGHVIGSRHTHACVWNGDNTQIDDCGNVIATNSGGTPEGIACYDNSNPILPGGAGGTIMSFCDLLSGESINFTNGFGTAPGALLDLIYNSANCQTGDQCATVVPGNNDCSNAIFVEGRINCTFFTFDNFLATASGETPGFICGSPGATNDVWFKSIVPSSGELNIETGQASGGLTNTVVQAYSGTCGNLTTLGCNDDNGTGNHALVRLQNLTPGDTVFIRVIDSGSDEEGIFDLCVYDASYSCSPDFDALIDFYNATNGASWTNNTGWIDGAANTNCEPCTWFGVTCDYRDKVIEIDLTNNNLSGSLPSNLNAIDALRKLDLWDNNITGSIPSNLGDLVDLEYLDLSSNSFTGGIPLTFGNLVDLRILYLENNMLTGNLPVAIGNIPLLDIYFVKDNNLDGCIPGTYASLCFASSIRMSGNTNLPGGGDFDAFCDSGLGGDFDMDGFCAGPGPGDDCDDHYAGSYPGAIEVCDGRDNDCNGSTDEGFVGTKTWIGGNGDWNTPASWSGGSLPLPCDDVIINTGVTVTIQAATIANGRSVTINGTGSLINNGELNITGSSLYGLSVTSNANYQNVNDVNIMNISIHGIHCDGIIQNFGTIMVNGNIGVSECFLTVNGTLNNNPGSILTLGN